MILANVILRPKSKLKLYALNLLRKSLSSTVKNKNSPNYGCFNTYQGHPKGPMRDSFK